MHAPFLHGYNLRGAGAVLHSHSINAVLTMTIFEKTFCATDMEMIKGIDGIGAFDELEVPILDNSVQECDLADSLAEVIGLIRRPRRC